MHVSPWRSQLHYAEITRLHATITTMTKTDIADLPPTMDYAERKQRGRTARQRTPRREQNHPGRTDRDPIELIAQNNQDRLQRLIPLRYGRMLASPFAFFRGSAVLQAHDLAGTPNAGFDIQICGDAHLANFGGYGTPERSLLFGLNDFDETAPGPWEWDIKRLAASLTVAARDLGLKPAAADEAVYRMVRRYQQRMADYAQMGALDIWYDRITFDRLLATYTDPDAQKRLRRGMERAADRSHASLLPRLGEKIDGRWHIRDAPPTIFHVHGNTTLFNADDDWLRVKNWQQLRQDALDRYMTTLQADRRRLLRRFSFQDVAFKVVGVGSVGTRCLIMLLTDLQDNPLFLQIKQANPSVIAQFHKSRVPTHQGRRVVEGQRLMQSASDMFLGWTHGPFGRQFYLRQLRDMKLSVNIDLMDDGLLAGYADLCGWVLARAHAKSGDCAPEISGYLGDSERMAEVMIDYANQYADQVERDYERFAHACRSGQLEARSEEDIAADFQV